MTIHSFRRVLRVRRHIHAIPWNPGGKALILPTPVPLLGLAYFASLEAVFFIVSRLPVIGIIADLPFVPWWLWWVIPCWLTYLALTSSFDGRMPHMWARSWFMFRLRAKRTRAGLPVSDGRSERLRARVRWYADEHHPRLSRARVKGPAVIEFRVPVRVGYDMPFSHRAEVAWPDERALDEQSRRVDHRLEIKP